jgi:hypothetical protein
MSKEEKNTLVQKLAEKSMQLLAEIANAGGVLTSTQCERASDLTAEAARVGINLVPLAA